MKKLVLWQVTMTATVLTTFFVMQYITGNAFAAAAAAFFVAIVAFAITTTIGYAILFTICAAQIVAVAAAAKTAADTIVIAAIITAVVTAIAAISASAIYINDDMGIKDKDVWISCLVQFIFILMPLLIGILH